MSLQLWTPKDDPDTIRRIATGLSRIQSFPENGESLSPYRPELISLRLEKAWQAEAGKAVRGDLNRAQVLLRQVLGQASVATIVLGTYAQRLDDTHAEIHDQRARHDEALLDHRERVRMLSQVADPVVRQKGISEADEELAAEQRRILGLNRQTREEFYRPRPDTIQAMLSDAVDKMKREVKNPQWGDQPVGPAPTLIVLIAVLHNVAADLVGMAAIEDQAAAGVRLGDLPRPQESKLPVIFEDLVTTLTRRLGEYAELLRTIGTAVGHAADGYAAGEQNLLDQALHALEDSSSSLEYTKRELLRSDLSRPR